MNSEKIRSVIVEMFEASGELGHYRLRYSATVIEGFVADRSVALAKEIAMKVEEGFKEHAASFTKQGISTETSQLDPAAKEVEEQDQTDLNALQPEVPTCDVGGLTEQPPFSSGEAAASQGLASALKTPAGDVQSVVPEAMTVSAPSVDQAEPNSSPVNDGSPEKQLVSVAKSEDPMPRRFSFRLKGGKLQAGVPYDGRIESADGVLGAVADILTVELPSDIGLQFDLSDPSHITGTPTISGDVSFSFTYRVVALGAGGKVLTSSISVFINHDPKTLWKDLLSDKEDPFWKPDIDTAFQQVGVRKVIAASKRGRSHAHEGKFRDDDFSIIDAGESGWVVIAVADGAGSATKARKGSQIAVHRAVEVLVELLAGQEGSRLEASITSWHRGEATKESVVSEGLYPVLGIAAFKACKAIEAEASAVGVAVREFSTTLLVTVYKKTSIGHIFATYWVGDGGVGIYLKDGAPKLLGKVDSGEFAGQTRFLDHKVMTTQEIAARLHFEVVDDFKALVAMSDGITDPYFMTDNNLESGEYWDKLWSEIDPALNADDPQAALLSWLDFWSPGNHDDRTIAILW